MKELVIGTIAVVFVLMPLLVFLIMYIEGGLLGVGLYIGYAFAALVIFKLPLIGVKLWRSL